MASWALGGSRYGLSMRVLSRQVFRVLWKWKLAPGFVTWYRLFVSSRQKKRKIGLRKFRKEIVPVMPLETSIILL